MHNGPRMMTNWLSHLLAAAQPLSNVTAEYAKEKCNDIPERIHALQQ